MDHISFKSRINFVDINTFKRLQQNGGKYVAFKENSPLYCKSDKFYTSLIKTCTGGGITDGNTNAVGFHLLDSYENYSQIDKICKYIIDAVENSPLSGLLVGGKNLLNRKYSRKMFQAMKNNFSDRVDNLSIFEEHANHYGATSYIYDLKTDTWTLCADFIDSDLKYHNVNSLEKLKNFYKKIKIAKNDILLIDGVSHSQNKLKEHGFIIK